MQTFMWALGLVCNVSSRDCLFKQVTYVSRSHLEFNVSLCWRILHASFDMREYFAKIWTRKCKNLQIKPSIPLGYGQMQMLFLQRFPRIFNPSSAYLVKCRTLTVLKVFWELKRLVTSSSEELQLQTNWQPITLHSVSPQSWCVVTHECLCPWWKGANKLEAVGKDYNYIKQPFQIFLRKHDPVNGIDVLSCSDTPSQSVNWPVWQEVSGQHHYPLPLATTCYLWRCHTCYTWWPMTHACLGLIRKLIRITLQLTCWPGYQLLHISS